MELINTTPFVAGVTTTADKSGRPFLLLVVKATYRLPLPGESVQLMPEQQALLLADTATGKPGESAPEHDSDFVLCKPRCEVLMLGSAWAPRGVASSMVETGLRVGPMSKLMRVFGPRSWRASGMQVAPGAATPFLRQPLSYDIAFGGTRVAGDGSQVQAYLPNPVGLGYVGSGPVDGVAMAQTEAPNWPVTRPDEAYVPMSFGPLGRNWASRMCYAGTYDAHWQQHVFPFLPVDFDERYFQSAPQDQQLDSLHGGMPVTLLNLTHPALTPSGRLDFVLPDLSLEASFFLKHTEPRIMPARPDTLVLQPDKQCFTVTWRAACALRRDAAEVEWIRLHTAVPVARCEPSDLRALT